MEVPLLRVSRPVSACSRCRNAKVKCDGKLPACTACERAGKSKDCSSANDEFARGKERSYVASLESRIERLEKEISRRGKNGHHEPLDNRHLSRHHQQQDASDVDELVSDFGYLSVHATASGYHGFMGEISFARLVLSTATRGDWQPLAASPLPARETASALLQECIEGIFALYPVLSDTAVYGAFESLYQHHGRFCSTVDSWNMRMVLALACMSRSQVKDDLHYRTGVGHVIAALKDKESVIQPGSIAAAQSVLLLVLYSMLNPSHFDCWYLIGIASRIMVDIGLHQEDSGSFRAKQRHLELRRRIFYCVYSLDRAISMTKIRTFSFTDDSVNVEGSVSLLTKIRRVASPAYQKLYGLNRENAWRPWHERIGVLNSLRASLSEELESSSDATKQVLRCEFFYDCILLLRPPGTSVDHDAYGIRLFFEYAIGYAQGAWLMCHHFRGPQSGTALEVERAILVGSQLSEVLMDSSSQLVDSVGGTDLEALRLSVGQSLPPLEERSASEISTKAIDAMTQLDQVVDTLIGRFGEGSKHGRFKSTCLETLRSLYARQVLS